MLTGSIKIDPVRIDLSFAAGGCGIHHGIDVSHARKVVDTLTAGADKMVMPLHIGVKPVGTFTCRDLHDLTHLSEERKISIDRAETDIRVLLAEAGVDRVGSWMIGTTIQELLDRLALSAVFFLHILRLLNNYNCYYN